MRSTVPVPDSGCGIATFMPRNSTCGSWNTWSMLFTGPHGTPRSVNPAIQCAWDFCDVTAWIRP